MVSESIPLFPPWCAVKAEEKICTALGISMPCVANPDIGDIFSQEIVIGHWLTTFTLMAIGIINLSYAQFPVQRADTMKIITGLYAFCTGLFSLSRLFFGISRFTLMAAAVHNMAEWSMLMMVAAVNKSETDVENRIKYFLFYMYAVIVLVVMMPTLAGAAIVEQASGITIDFTLAMLFAYMYFSNRDKPEVSSFYYYPAMAHNIHLVFTILPLVMANFHVGYTSWYNSFYLETAVYVTSPITHILYMIWSLDVDRRRSVPDEKDKTGQIPANLRASNLKSFVAIGFVLGLMTVIGTRVALGTCNSVPSCTPSREIVGTAEAVVHPGFDIAFEDYIHTQQLVSKAHAFKGNKGYSVVKDVINPNTYRFIEHWATKEDLDEWVNNVGHKVFSQPAMVNLLVGGKLQRITGYTNLLPSECRNATYGGVSLTVPSSCDKVWSVVSDWADCSWVVGCKYAVVEWDTKTRTLHQENGSTMRVALRKMDNQTHEIVYEVVGLPKEGKFSSMTGFVGNLHVGVTGSAPNCAVRYIFAVPKGPNAVTADFVYRDFLESRVPAMKKLFNK